MTEKNLKEYKFVLIDRAETFLKLVICALPIFIILFAFAAIFENFFLYLGSFFLLILIAFGNVGIRLRIILEIPDVTLPVVYLQDRNYFLSKWFIYKSKYRIKEKRRFGIYHTIERGVYSIES